jgi:hypothetical protein
MLYRALMQAEFTETIARLWPTIMAEIDVVNRWMQGNLH